MDLYLRNSVLATIVYYDIFDYPLTLIEIFKYLINPARISMVPEGIGEVKISDISDELSRLVRSDIIAEKNGFYFISGRHSLYSARIEKQKISDKKWRKFLRLVKLLSLAPYLRGVFASGSMALGNTDEDSDFDVLVIAKSGRLYTCRLFLWLISSLLGVRRKKYQKTAPDKLCFNHYITDDSLKIGHQSLFNAQTYVNLKPTMIGPDLINNFFSSNLWLNNYVYNFKVQDNFVRRSVNPPRILRFLASVIEIVLNSPIGNWFESYARSYQQKIIRKNPVTYEPGGRTVFTDKEIEFHPHSFEKIVIEKYNQGLKKMGIVSYIQEVDSGLLK